MRIISNWFGLYLERSCSIFPAIILIFDARGQSCASTCFKYRFLMRNFGFHQYEISNYREFLFEHNSFETQHDVISGTSACIYTHTHKITYTQTHNTLVVVCLYMCVYACRPYVIRFVRMSWCVMIYRWTIGFLPTDRFTNTRKNRDSQLWRSVCICYWTTRPW